MNKIKTVLVLVFALALMLSVIPMSASAAKVDELEWLTEDQLPKLNDYAYSFAIVGDPQIMNQSNDGSMGKIYDWISKNADSHKIKWALTLGDITHKNTAAEYTRAKLEFVKLAGKVPHSFVRGNHDKLPEYSSQFLFKDWQHCTTGAYDETMLNTYLTFKAGQVDYLVLNLDFTHKDELIAWANDIITKHPNHQVIVNTHVYKTAAGTWYDKESTNSKEGYDIQNNAYDLWEKMLRKHPNVVMVLCGHNPTDKLYNTSWGGGFNNKIQEFVLDAQDLDEEYGGLGMVAMFYFSADGKNLQVRYYSTVHNKYLKASNQYDVVIDVPSLRPTTTTAKPTKTTTASPTFQTVTRRTTTTQKTAAPTVIDTPTTTNEPTVDANATTATTTTAANGGGSQGLDTTTLILIIVGAVVVLGGGAVLVLVLLKKKQ